MNAAIQVPIFLPETTSMHMPNHDPLLFKVLCLHEHRVVFAIDNDLDGIVRAIGEVAVDALKEFI